MKKILSCPRCGNHYILHVMTGTAARYGHMNEHGDVIYDQIFMQESNKEEYVCSHCNKSSKEVKDFILIFRDHEEFHEYQERKGEIKQQVMKAFEEMLDKQIENLPPAQYGYAVGKYPNTEGIVNLHVAITVKE